MISTKGNKMKLPYKIQEDEEDKSQNEYIETELKEYNSIKWIFYSLTAPISFIVQSELYRYFSNNK
jgi:hypothetical protein